ncbi:PIN-like domain-containing protein [Pseudomonas sp. LB3P81]
MAKDTSPENDKDSINSYKERFSNPELIFSRDWKDVHKLKNTCIVTLDTNVLLAPYKLRKESINEIEKIYKELKNQKRIFLSKQAAREFAANKSTKLSEIHNSIYDRKVKLKQLPEYPILFDLPEYKDLQKSTNELKEYIEKYNSNLESIGDKIKSWVWHDPVVQMYKCTNVQMYKGIFSPEVVVEHELTDEELAKDLIRREKYKIPPGYKDASKDDNSEGDLSVWHTILNLGKKYKTDMVFVSEDRKPDWWNRSNGNPLVPKYELIHEYQNVSEGASIHLLILSEFLKIFDAPQEVIKEVQSEEQKSKETQHSKVSDEINSRVQNLLKRQSIIINLKMQNITRANCSLCNNPFEFDLYKTRIEHIMPLSQGGSNELSNLSFICQNCNSHTATI